MNALIQVQDLGQSSDGHVVFQSVSFTVLAGQHLALLGSSGCGKSTLLRLIAGLDAPVRGRIWLAGQLVSDNGRILIPPHQRGLAMVFQDLALWPTLSALENVLLGMAQSHWSRRQQKERATEALTRCKVGELAARKPGTLSIGQQQRVALARAIAGRPQLLLLDEPFSSLDPLLREELMTEVRRLAGEINATLVLVTHDVLEALALAQRAIVLEDARLAESGELVSVLAAPRSRLLRQCAAQIGRLRSG
jgi:iron(III) transport system ATP-binding protein